MKKWTVLGIFTVFFAVSLTAATPKGWTSDFVAAQKKAAEEKRLMYVLFTGSDWCRYCVQLAKNVLSTAEFQALGKEDYIFVYIDFPRNSKADNPIANRVLAQQYKVRGFPTALVMTPDGKVLEEIVGTNTASRYVGKLRDVRKRNAAR